MSTSFMRRKGEDGVAPARAVTLITRIVSAALQGRESQAAIDAQVLAQPIILGAQTLPDASATLKTAPGAPLNLTLNLGLPGQSRLRADGDLETAAEAKFRGDVAFISADFALLRDWATQGAPPAAAKIVAFADALPYRSASLSGAVEASPTGFSGRNLKLILDRSTLTGALAFKGPDGGQAGRLDVDLASDSLDVDGLPSLAVGKSVRRSRPLAFAEGGFAAYRPHRRSADRQRLVGGERRQERAERHAQAPERGGPRWGVSRCRGRHAARTRLRRRVICEPTGCTISQPSFRASRRAIGAGCWSRGRASFRRRRSPSALMAARPTLAAFPPINSLRANGSAGETQFSVTLDPRPNDTGRALTVSLDSPNSGALLRQLGVHTPTSGGGRAHIALNANGGWEKGYDVDATSQLAGADLDMARPLPARGGKRATRSCLGPPRPSRRTSPRLPSLSALRPRMAACSVPPTSGSMRPCAAIDGVSHGSRR